MSKIKLTNRIGGELVDSLSSGTTLRLYNKSTITIDESEFTPHLQTLVDKGLVLKEEIITKAEKKETSAKNDTTNKGSKK